MAGKTKHKKRGMRQFIILCTIVLVSGAALWQTGALQNPLRMTAMLFSTSDMGDNGERVRPENMEANDEGERPEPPEGMTFEGSEGGSSMALSLEDIEWAQLPAVLYNLWIMMALTVVVIVISRMTGWIIKLTKTPGRKVATS